MDDLRKIRIYVENHPEAAAVDMMLFEELLSYAEHLKKELDKAKKDLREAQQNASKK